MCFYFPFSCCCNSSKPVYLQDNVLRDSAVIATFSSRLNRIHVAENKELSLSGRVNRANHPLMERLLFVTGWQKKNTRYDDSTCATDLSESSIGGTSLNPIQCFSNIKPEISSEPINSTASTSSPSIKECLGLLLIECKSICAQLELAPTNIDLLLSNLQRSNLNMKVLVNDLLKNASQQNNLTNQIHVSVHDLRSPLHAVLATIENYMDSKIIEEDYSQTLPELCGILNQCYIHLDDVIKKFPNDSFDLSLNPPPFDSESFLLKNLEDSLHALTDQLAENNNLTVRFHGFDDCDFQKFKGNFTYIKRVLVNLIVNAIKYGIKDKVDREFIDVSVCVKEISIGRSMKFEVKDHGPGIGDEIKNSLFYSFCEVSGPSSSSQESSGIGLALTREMVEQMNVDQSQPFIGVDTVLGEGSSFWFRADVHCDAEIERLSSESIDSTSSEVFSRINILWADDQASIRKQSERQLKLLKNKNPKFVKDGEEAFNCATKINEEEKSYHIIFLDDQMPKYSGIEVAERIYCHAKKMKVIFFPFL